VREARPGDRYLLCTDGLTGPVGDRDTLSLALQIEDPQSACDHLVELALRGGGPDNVTVIVADVLAGNGAAAAPVVAGAAAQAAHRIPDSLGGPAAVRARTAEVPATAAVHAIRPCRPARPSRPPRRQAGRPVLAVGCAGRSWG
jgi:protein phosphatase